MSKILTATLAALTLATAAMVIPGEAVAKGKGGFGKHHGHGKHHVIKHGKIYVDLDNDDDDDDCKWVWTKKRGWVRVCDDDDD